MWVGNLGIKLSQLGVICAMVGVSLGQEGRKSWIVVVFLLFRSPFGTPLPTKVVVLTKLYMWMDILEKIIVLLWINTVFVVVVVVVDDVIVCFSI